MPDFILINERRVSFAEITSARAIPKSPFESSAFRFIREWLSGTKEFSLHTSGSTGKPKPVTITREQMRLSALRTVRFLNLKEGDTALVCLHTDYIAGKMMLVRALEANLKVVVVEPASDPFKNMADDLQVDFMAVVPLQLQQIVSSTSGIDRLNKMKSVIAGGAAVNEKLIRTLELVTTHVYATYGMTETISHVALQLLNTHQRTAYFETLPGVNIRVDDRECLVVEDDILDKPVITNDLVELVDENRFRWVGRFDTIINTGGVKVAPEKIEKVVERVLEALSIQRNFFVAGIPHETLGQEIVLLMEGNPLAAKTHEALLHEIDQHLSNFERPKRILYLDQLVYTATGKIDRIQNVRSIPKE
jgi:o-succinylbenzoate---CoA ligase